MSFISLALLAAVAQQTPPPKLGDKVEEVVTSPAEDINVKKRAIPAVLTEAQDSPYATVASCAGIKQAIEELNAVLGPDFDVETKRDRKIRGTQVAKSLVQGLIPFRGVVREVSGAAGAERAYNNAVDAGIARRGFLRGIAAQRRCRL